MERSEVRRWAFFFCGILIAIVIADAVSGMILSMTGLSGVARFLAGFVLYAAVFFAMLYVIERVTGLSFFEMGSRQD